MVPGIGIIKGRPGSGTGIADGYKVLVGGYWTTTLSNDAFATSIDVASDGTNGYTSVAVSSDNNVMYSAVYNNVPKIKIGSGSWTTLASQAYGHSDSTACSYNGYYYVASYTQMVHVWRNYGAARNSYELPSDYYLRKVRMSKNGDVIFIMIQTDTGDYYIERSLDYGATWGWIIGYYAWMDFDINSDGSRILINTDYGSQTASNANVPGIALTGISGFVNSSYIAMCFNGTVYSFEDNYFKKYTNWGATYVGYKTHANFYIKAPFITSGDGKYVYFNNLLRFDYEANTFLNCATSLSQLQSISINKKHP